MMRWFIEPVTYDEDLEKDWATRPVVEWLEKQDDEKEQAYMARATSMARAMGLTRGVAQVGIRRAEKDKDREMRKQKPNEFRVTGSNFSEVQLHSKTRRRGATFWNFMAKREDGQDALEMEHDDTVLITVVEARRQRKWTAPAGNTLPAERITSYKAEKAKEV